MTKTPSMIIDQPLPQTRKDSSLGTRSNSHQNVDGTILSDSHEKILYRKISDNISGAISDSLQAEQLSMSSVVVSQVVPANEHPSSQSGEASDGSGSDSERYTKLVLDPAMQISIQYYQYESTPRSHRLRHYRDRPSRIDDQSSKAAKLH
ncbi:hypothetical protein F5146DRAFT_1048794 [Armillaria mellea]|nr:hypothetical protein F5146DRAFT_1048794 [Armillaria mellea]